MSMWVSISNRINLYKFQARYVLTSCILMSFKHDVSVLVSNKMCPYEFQTRLVLKSFKHNVSFQISNKMCPYEFQTRLVLTSFKQDVSL